MANDNLTGQTIANTYNQVLITADTGGITGADDNATQIHCGAATAGAGNVDTTPLYLSTNRVGIGTDGPGAQLDIEVASGGYPILRLGRGDSDTDRTMGELYFGNGADGFLCSIAGYEDSATDAGGLKFLTEPTTGDNTVRMTITSAGLVGIGTDGSPGALLHIDRLDNTPIHATQGPLTDAKMIIRNASSSAGNGHASLIFQTNNAQTSISSLYTSSEQSAMIFHTETSADTHSVSMKILYNGAIYMPYYGDGTASFAGGNGLLATSSDERLKENVTALSDGLSIVNKLNPVYYTWKEKEPSGKDNLMYVDDAPNGGKKLGFIAQQVGAVLPQLSPDWGKDNKQWRGIEDRAIIAVLTKSIQELSAKVEALENNNNEQGDSSNEQQGQQESESAGSGGGDSESEGEDSGGVEASNSDSSSSASGASDSSESSSGDGNESSGSSGSDVSDDSEGGSGEDGSGGEASGEPSAEWTKEELKEYMIDNAIAFNSGDTKDDLLMKIDNASSGEES